MTPQRIAITTIISLLVAGFCALLLFAIYREPASTNAYAQLAEGWLNGRFDTDRCFDTDCAVFDGRTYVIFPPMPGLLALPFVALFGAEFNHFIPLTAVAFALSGWLWWHIAKHERLTRDLALLVVLLILVATPLFFVTLRSNRVWFFAQSWSFLFTSGALYFSLVRPRALLAGLFIGMAFLCRQMSILYLPFLYVLMLDPRVPLLRINGTALRRATALTIFPLIALIIYLAYNYARFGSPLETGYAYIFPVDPTRPASEVNFLHLRVQELGIFSPHYFMQNVIYMFVAGPHVEFAGRYMTEMASFDLNGASPFLVTPALLFALLARWERSFWIGIAIVAVILGVTLFYHSNGYSQFSAQRYALDWLPIVFIFVVRGIKAEYGTPLAILTAYSMLVTLSMIVIGSMIAL